MTDRDRIVGAVLAGGESRRMGRDKALLRLTDGSTLLERTIATLRAAGLDEIVLSVSTARRGRALQDAVPAARGLRLATDATPGRGPLGGLHAALRAHPYRYVLLVACDMPRLDAAALGALIAEPRDADALVPRLAGWAQTLHALYGPACLPPAERLLAEGHLAMRDLLAAPGLRVRFLDETWLARAGAATTAFSNLNTPGDLAAATAPAEKERPANG